MQRIHVCVFIFLVGALFVIDGNCQFNRHQIKRNNKRLSTYHGKASPFGNRYYTIGISFNAFNYYGDLAPRPTKNSTDIKLTKPGLGLSFARRMGPRYTLQGGFTYGIIQGSDNRSASPSDLKNGIYRYHRNLSFRNHIKELSVLALFDLFENLGMYNRRPNWSPFGFIGLAVFHHNPKALIPKKDIMGNDLPNAGKWVALQPLGTEGQHSELTHDDANYGIKPYKLVQIAISFGFGVRFKLSNNLDLSSELSFRYLFTDYLDDVSRNYVDLGAFTNKTAQALSYRTNEVTQPDFTYKSKYDDQYYHVLSGYGSEHRNNIRGNRQSKDAYTVFTLRFAYILLPKYWRAKSR